MNKNIIEIINYLMNMMMNSKQNSLQKEEIVQRLEHEGYKIVDIEKAIELFFTDQLADTKFDNMMAPHYNRILTAAEKIYIPVDIQGLIRRLIYINILSPEESETLIARTLQNSYGGSAETNDIWELLKDIISDEAKLEIIAEKIPEFNDTYYKNYKYIN